MIPGAACPMQMGGAAGGGGVVVSMVADVPVGGTLIDSLTVRTSESLYRGGYADLGRKPSAGGKWIFEVELLNEHGSTHGGASVGLASTVPTLGTYGPASAGNDCVTWGYVHGPVLDGSMVSGGTGTSPADWVVGGIISIVVDFNANSIKYYLNGAPFSSALTIIGDSEKFWHPLCGDNYGAGNYTLRFNFTDPEYPVSGATPWAG